jgi:hypothetical protein
VALLLEFAVELDNWRADVSADAANHFVMLNVPKKMRSILVESVVSLEFERVQSSRYS